ncbi:MAG: hypothetical protein H7A46_04185 [Verrucomicrobiales bacterium]|nr:hypothetical protein [Verrucomicrobiales bacterium]
MKVHLALALSAFLAATSVPQVRALAGDLDRPGLAFPEGFSPDLRERIMSVLTAAPETYAGGHFVNALTTLRYAGDTAALNRFLAGLAGCPGMRLQVGFAAEPEAPAWTVIHNAWGDATLVHVRINPAAKDLKLADLVIPEIAGPTPASTGLPTSQTQNSADKATFGPTLERVIPFGVPCAQKYFQFRTGKVFPIGDGPGDTSDHTEEWAAIEAAGGVDAECFGGEKGFQLVGRGCLFTHDAVPEWEDATADTVMRKLRRATWITGVIEAGSGEMARLPKTWLFRTFNGDCGMLQICGIAGDAEGLKVRYKVVEPRAAVGPVKPQ